MLKNVIFIALLISLSKRGKATDEQQCSAERKSCGESDASELEPKYSELNNEIEQRIQEALFKYKPCSSDSQDANCTCHASVIKSDLAPYQSTGVTWQMLENAAKYGTRYKVYEHQLYRDENCMFPARCQGIEHFLLELLPELPNLDLVVNTRDWPQLHNAWDNRGPIFSFSKTREHRDFMYPAWTFWAGGPATQLHPTGIGRWDLMRERLSKRAAAVPWSEKQTLGFFRGSRTSDERDSLILLSRRQPQLVAAAYTKNQAWKSPKDTLNAPAAEEVSFEDHCNYKYLFNFRGVAASFRLKHLFLCKSLVFHVGDEWQEFFYAQLKPWVHYVPLPSYPSEQQYEEMLKYFKDHDALAQQIAERGYDFVWQHLRMADVQCYWRRLLQAYAKLLRYEVQPNGELIRIGGVRNEL